MMEYCGWSRLLSYPPPFDLGSNIQEVQLRDKLDLLHPMDRGGLISCPNDQDKSNIVRGQKFENLFTSNEAHTKTGTYMHQ
jgi:hypothetical protein